MYVTKKKQGAATSGSRSLVFDPQNGLPIISQGQYLLIDARLLHKQLKSGYQFSDWIKTRITEYGFTENEDFFASGKTEAKRGGHNRIDYHLTLDMAKELAMLERNEVGRAIRRYFIEKEKEARGISQLPPERGLFSGIRAHKINERPLYPYREMLVRCGYKPNNNGGRRNRYPNHFVMIGDKLYITQEFALHLFRQKQLYNNRTVLHSMQPVLALDFGKQGGIYGDR